MTFRWSRVIPAEDGSERFVEQNADVPVPPVVAVVEMTPEEHISERTQIVDVPVLLDQSGDQACRLPADTVHRQGYCRHACCDTATGPVTIAHTGDQARRDSADTAHRQGCCHTYCDTATGPQSPADVPLISQINQVTKHAEISQTQYINHAAAVPVVIQRQAPQIQMVSKTVKVPLAPLIAFRQWTSQFPLFRRKLMRRSSSFR